MIISDFVSEGNFSFYQFRLITHNQNLPHQKYPRASFNYLYLTGYNIQDFARAGQLSVWHRGNDERVKVRGDIS